MKAVRKISAIVLSLMIIVSLTSCAMLGGSKKAKDFTAEEMTITLTEQFIEQEAEGQTAAFISTKYTVTALKESNALFEQAGISTDISLGDYADIVINNNGLTSTYEETDGIVNFTYEKEISGDHFSYLATVHKSNDGFWLIQFATKSDKFEESKDQFIQWAKTVRFE